MKFISSAIKLLPCLLLLLLSSALKVLGEFSFIPAGNFTMGNEGSANEFRTVELSAFCMGKCEVTKAKWDEVRTWALSNGYDLAPGEGKASDHPVQQISWYDVVKWCNARSEKEGLKPFYYTDDAQTKIYRTGKVDVTNAQVKWTANGYRLPTEAEWEKAARGGLVKALYPWGATISHDDANYFGKNGYHPDFDLSPPLFTSPCGSFKSNGYGLYDMAGNVNEWCWDRDADYAKGDQKNPIGPTSGSSRIFRGGSWKESDLICQVGYRLKTIPSYSADHIGFRLATTPRITSSMARIAIVRGKQIQRYNIQTNFGAKNFTASGLPPGLSLRSTGIIVGAPTKVGTYRATITATKMQGGKLVKTAKATKVFVVK
jgi:formylglycine-generating enzyme required for sulfatase activity